MDRRQGRRQAGRLRRRFQRQRGGRPEGRQPAAAERGLHRRRRHHRPRGLLLQLLQRHERHRRRRSRLSRPRGEAPVPDEPDRLHHAQGLALHLPLPQRGAPDLRQPLRSEIPGVRPQHAVLDRRDRPVRAAWKPFRRAAGAAATAAVLVTAGAVIAPLPAQAATSVSIRAVGGDRQISAAWGTVAKATGYTVRWGRGTSTAHVLHTKGTTIRIGGVANRTTYSVRVTADGVSASSKRVTATPSPYAPTPITSVRAVPAGPNQIRVSWTGGGRARSVAVMAGADSQTKTFHFATAWHPAALSSWTVTIPAGRRGVLGAGTGNAIFVRV